MVWIDLPVYPVPAGHGTAPGQACCITQRSHCWSISWLPSHMLGPAGQLGVFVCRTASNSPVTGVRDRSLRELAVGNKTVCEHQTLYLWMRIRGFRHREHKYFRQEVRGPESPLPLLMQRSLSSLPEEGERSFHTKQTGAFHDLQLALLSDKKQQHSLSTTAML